MIFKRNRPPKDNLVDDIRKMISESKLFESGETEFMTRLVTYINKRDRRLWNHAYKLGREQK
jgi:hypothetical protein